MLYRIQDVFEVEKYTEGSVLKSNMRFVFAYNQLSFILIYTHIQPRKVFKIKPYDICVANEMIDGRHWNFIWYVDDNKMPHVEPNVVTNILNILRVNLWYLVISRGSKHSF